MPAVAPSNLFGAAALACLLLGVGMLAGLWWAVLIAAPVLGWLAYVAYLAEARAKAVKVAEDRAALEQARADRPRR